MVLTVISPLPASRALRRPEVRVRPRRKPVGRVLAGLLFAAVSGCAASGTRTAPENVSGGAAVIMDRDAAASAPRDFAVDVLILAGPLRDAGERVDERPLRLTISADGSVHATLDERVSGLTVPPRIRTIDHPAMGEVWTSARTLGLLDPDLDAPPVHPASIVPGPAELVAVISIQAEGRHRSIVVRADGPQRLDEDLSTFIRQLASLAWATDRPETAVRIIPRRYELGGDPYARYRPGPGAGAG